MRKGIVMNLNNNVSNIYNQGAARTEITPPVSEVISKDSGGNTGGDFESVFADAVQELNSAEANADSTLVELATGQTDDIAGAVIKAEKAQLAFGTALKMRQEILEAYNKIMQMPV